MLIDSVACGVNQCSRSNVLVVFTSDRISDFFIQRLNKH